jgi:two-component system, LuxR family, response regulator FixJ
MWTEYRWPVLHSGAQCGPGGKDMPCRYLVAVVDDDEAVRLSTVRLLARRGLDAAPFVSGDEFLAAELPGNLDCVLLDLRMPGADGISVLRSLKERELWLKVIILTGHGDIGLAVEAMRLGAIDFLEKPYDPVALVESIRHVCAMPPLTGGLRADEEARAKVAKLPARQREVLYGILKGQQNKIIAYELGLSIRTVEAYRGQLLTNLGVRGTAEAVRLALAAGMDVRK